MARFPRPPGTIEHHAELRKWDVIWHVYGIFRPFVSGPNIVTRPSFRLDKNSVMPGYIVFKTRSPRFDFVSQNFASDGNLLPDQSHNDNYWCRTERDAELVLKFLQEQWTANPEMAEREREDMLRERELDCLMEDA